MKNLFLISRSLFLGLFLIVFTQSCTDLDEELFDQVTTDSFFQSDEEFISALGQSYTTLYGYMGDFYGLQEVSSDEMVVPTRGADWDDGGHWRRLHQHQYNPLDPLVGGGWTFAFGGINTCNRLIFQFEELNNPSATTFIGELKVLRAMYYWFLLDLYGNVPLVTDFDVPLDFAPSTSSRAEIYAFVDQEIRDNIGGLTRTVGADAYGRMNFWAAKMLQAKLYMGAEEYTGTPQWQAAADATAEIINSGNFSLAPNFFDNFVVANEGSPEFIFAIPYDQVFAQGNNLVVRTLHYGSQATYNLTAQPWNGYSSVQEFYESFGEDDIRRESFIVGPQFTAAGARILDSGAEEDDPDGPPLTFTPEINELGPNALRQAGARVGKFEFALGSTQHMSNDMPIFRYSDVLLMRAEALFRLGQTGGEALDLVNQIRARAEAAAFTELTEESLLAERGREMFAEGYRRSDLIRFGKFNEAWRFKDASSPTKNIFPVPASQLDANPNLTQNPGY